MRGIMSKSVDSDNLTPAFKTVQGVFPKLGEDDARKVIMEAEICTYPTGTILCHEGQYENTFYIVVSGEVDITVLLDDGQKRHITCLSEGQFFGELALIENKPRTATVTTTKETLVIQLSKEPFRTLLRRQPSVAMVVLEKLTANLRATDQATIYDLSRTNAELRTALEELKAAQAELVAKERMQRDLEIAAQVQGSLLPNEFPKIHGWSCYGTNVPARTVGGDLFDVLRIDANHIGMLLADVADKSVHAALIMAVVKTLVLIESKHNLSPREVLLNVHRGLIEVAGDRRFVTAVYGVLDIANGKLRYVRAGHDLPLLVRANGKHIESLGAEGRFLGVIDELHLEESVVTMDPGDTLCLYSDGIPDACNESMESYGMERFEQCVIRHAGLGPRDLCHSILNDIYKYENNALRTDDMTLFLIKRWDQDSAD